MQILHSNSSMNCTFFLAICSCKKDVLIARKRIEKKILFPCVWSLNLCTVKLMIWMCSISDLFNLDLLNFRFVIAVVSWTHNTVFNWTIQSRSKYFMINKDHLSPKMNTRQFFSDLACLVYRTGHWAGLNECLVSFSINQRGIANA